IANGADIAREAGLFPPEVVRPETPDGGDPPGAVADAPAAPPAAAKAQAAAPTAPTPAPEAAPGAQAALDRVNYYRSLMGLGPLRLDPALTRAASAHAAYYRQNAGDGT